MSGSTDPRRALAARLPGGRPLRSLTRSFVLVGLVAGSFSVIPPAAAATITVTEDDDEVNTDGDCSLREAIRAAYINLQVDQCAQGSASTTDVITVPSETYTLSVAGADNNALTGDLDISGATTIQGADMSTTTIDGGGIDRVFEILAGANVAMSELTVTGGDVTGEGGGILNAGSSLTLTNVSVTGNAASQLAGGITNRGPLEIVGGAVSANTSGTGIAGIYNEGFDLTIRGSELRDNTGTGGTGGALLNSGDALIEDTTIDNNDGLAQINHPVGVDFTLTIRGTTITGGNRGAIDNNGSLVIENTTISGNTSPGAGAGIQTSSDNATVSIVNSTITGNTAGSGGITCCNGGGGISHAAGSQVTLRNTIVAGNEHGPDPDGPTPDCDESHIDPVPMISQGGNVIGEIEGCTFTPQPSDQIGTDASPVDPMLDVLADNGGPTETHELLLGSPAIDSGVGCPPPAADQREVARPQGPACDSGSFETTPPSSSITFPTDGTHYTSPSYAAGCATPSPDVCGTATENPDGVALDLVEVRIQRSDGMFWDGDSWGSTETWIPADGLATWSYGFAPGEGTYTVSSRATDVDGYVEATATATFTVDDTSPDTDITKKPRKRIKTERRRVKAKLRFGSDEPGTSFECKLDRQDWEDCHSPLKERVGRGRHRLQVRAIDLAGNADPSPARSRFRVVLI